MSPGTSNTASDTPSDGPGDSFAARVIAWQRSDGRHDLPWQGNDPYRVWLSEVMLQQTQVATVLRYFDPFLARFPDVASLASAELDDVLARWSGLGYYSRARNLHRAAQAIVGEHGGAFPRSAQLLQTLPGIGRSTAAAIAAFSFGERAAILDGNVKRVLARVLAFEGDLAQASRLEALWAQATDLLPDEGIEPYTQGLMDLGATVCLARNPRCMLCPVQAMCIAARTGTQERYPVKTRRLVRRQQENAWLELRRGESVWLVQRPSTGIWAGLWSLPEFDSVAALQSAVAGWPGEERIEPPFVHVLTHRDWRLHPVQKILPRRVAAGVIAAIDVAWPKGRWFSVEEALALGLPAPLRKRLVE